MTAHQARRFWILWAPILLAGIALIAYSATLTAVLNGATILGFTIALAGLGAAAYDGRTS